MWNQEVFYEVSQKCMETPVEKQVNREAWLDYNEQKILWMFFLKV